MEMEESNPSLSCLPGGGNRLRHFRPIFLGKVLCILSGKFRARQK